MHRILETVIAGSAFVLFATGPARLRAVTHLDVSREQIDRAIGVFGELCASAAAA